MVRLLFLLLQAAIAIPCQGEFLRIEMRYGGMSCASCLRSVRSSFARHRAVAKVDVPVDRPAVRLELKPGNAMTLAEVRDILKSVGFTPEEAVIAAAGKIDNNAFEPSLLATRFALEEPAPDAASVVVEGIVPAGAASETLRVTAVKKR